MKKSLVVMTALLSMGATFVSCSKTDLYDEASAETAQKAEYEKAFVNQFGEVDPDQSWDFTQPTAQAQAPEATTRFGILNWLEPIWREYGRYNANLYAHAATDFEDVKAYAESDDVPVVAWPYDYAEIKLHPFYSKGSSSLSTYCFGIVYWGILITNFNVMQVSNLGTGWHSLITPVPGLSRRNVDVYYQVNTTLLSNNDDFKWVVAGFDIGFLKANARQCALTKCKQFVVNNHTYVALDCNGDGEYTDLICWVEDLSPAKRYMVEDLGAKGDFDFNDIVFDVVRKQTNSKNSKYECIVRAMGGTIDFTIQLGNNKPWVKSEHWDCTQMYNTTDIDFNGEYGRFDVENWVPENNDVKVIVKTKNGVFGLPFPKKGEVPFMVATTVEKDWTKEKVNVNEINWFGAIENDGTIQVNN